jgi:hypothetical protein
MTSLTLTSCYPPRIVYGIDGIKPDIQKDSIDVKLIKGSTFTTGGLSVHLSLYLEISNNREDILLINKNSTLELRTDSAVLMYEISSDSLVYALNKNVTKLLQLNFRVMDFDYTTYKTVEWPSFWSFCTHKIEMPRHKLFLRLDLRDDKGNKVEKCVILKPTGTRKQKYEEPPF